MSTILFAAGCGSSQTPSEVNLPRPFEFEEGTVEPEALADVGGTRARGQSFLAAGQELVELQLLVTRGMEADEEPLMVEIRSSGLNRRFGHGMIDAFNTRPRVPEWRPVQWVVQPTLERNEEYVIVLFSDSRPLSWQVAVGTNVYPDGRFLWSTVETSDLAFRAGFSNGAILQTEVIAFGRPIEADFDRRRYTSPASMRYRATRDFRNPHRVLPECIGSRCADLADSLKGSPEERAERARSAFEICKDGQPTILKVREPVSGLSCRDACRAHGIASCAGLSSRFEDYCDARAPLRRMRSCDEVVTSRTQPSKVHCICTDEPVFYSPIEDPEARKKFVRSRFRVERDGSPAPKFGAVVSGVTCAQACEDLGQPPCHAAGCDKLIVPSDTRCPPCSHGRKNRVYRLRIKAVEDVFFTWYRGSAWIIDPADATLTEFPDVPVYDLQPVIAGRFVYWSDSGKHSIGSRRNSTSIHAIDTRTMNLVKRSVPRRLRGCKVLAHESLLASVCLDPDDLQIFSISGKGRLDGPGAGHSRPRPISWDGETLKALDSSERMHMWSAGDGQWSVAPKPETIYLGINPESARRLQALHKTRPDAEGFVRGIYYQFDNNGLWSYDPSQDRFVQWPVNTRSGRVGPDLIGARGWIFDHAERVLKRIEITPYEIVGRYALIDRRSCEESLSCKPLPEPFEDLAIATLDASRIQGLEVVKGEEVESP